MYIGTSLFFVFLIASHDLYCNITGRSGIWKPPFIPMTRKWILPIELTLLSIVWVAIVYPFTSPSAHIIWWILPVAIFFILNIGWHIRLIINHDHYLRNVVYFLLHYLLMADLWLVSTAFLGRSWF